MKKKNMGIVAGLIALKSKVFGAGLPAQVPLYGVPQPSILEVGLNIFRGIIAPIVFIIGMVIYWQDSKSSKKKKFITTLKCLLIVIVIYYVIEFLLYMPGTVVE